MKKIFSFLFASFLLTACSSTSNTTSMGQTINQAQSDSNPIVIMETSLGKIEIEVYENKAPVSAANFLQYVDDGFYDETVFHRIIKGFMIQGGGFTEDYKQKPTRSPIKNEAENGLKNLRGSLAMARTSVVDSATSQFFINTVDNAFLDNGSRDFGYAVFAYVISGMDTVDKIEAVATGRTPMPDAPEVPILITKVSRK